MFIASLTRAGYNPLQDHRPEDEAPLDLRNVRYAVRITDGALGHWGSRDENDRRTEGDILCATVWQPNDNRPKIDPNKTLTRADKAKATQKAQSNPSRKMAGWAYAWPVMTLATDSGSPDQSNDACLPGETPAGPKGAKPEPPTGSGVNIDLSNTGTGGAQTGSGIPGFGSGTGTGGGVSDLTKPPGFGFVKVRPVKNQAWEEDERFEELEATVHKDFLNVPGGTPGIVISAVNERKQQPLYFPIMGNRLIAVNKAGNPVLGTRVYDLKPDDTLDEERAGPLQSMMRVVDVGGGPGQSMSLAWQLTNSGQDNLRGAGLVYGRPEGNVSEQPIPDESAAPAPSVPNSNGTTGNTRGNFLDSKTKTKGGGPQTKTQPPTATKTKNQVPGAIIGITSWLDGGGPFTLGGISDKHKQGESADGVINSVHLSTGAFFYGHGGDAPLDFSPVAYEPPNPLPVKTAAHIRMAPEPHTWPTGGAIGRWKIQGECVGETIDDQIVDEWEDDEDDTDGDGSGGNGGKGIRYGDPFQTFPVGGDPSGPAIAVGGTTVTQPVERADPFGPTGSCRRNSTTEVVGGDGVAVGGVTIGLKGTSAANTTGVSVTRTRPQNGCPGASVSDIAVPGVPTTEQLIDQNRGTGQFGNGPFSPGDDLDEVAVAEPNLGQRNARLNGAPLPAAPSSPVATKTLAAGFRRGGENREVDPAAPARPMLHMPLVPQMGGLSLQMDDPNRSAWQRAKTPTPVVANIGTIGNTTGGRTALNTPRGNITPTGTADGTILVMPPELTPADYANNFNPNTTVSTTRMLAVPGVETGWGNVDATGAPKDAVAFTAPVGGGTIQLNAYDNSGAQSKVLDVEDTGNIDIQGDLKGGTDDILVVDDDIKTNQSLLFAGTANQPTNLSTGNYGLWVDSDDDTLYYFDGSNNIDLTTGGVTGSGINSVAEDLSPQLGGDLDAQSFEINELDRLILNEGGTTTTPGANTVSIYAKADGLIYSKDDAGSETLMSGGAAATTLTGLSDVAVGGLLDDLNGLSPGAGQIIRTDSTSGGTTSFTDFFGTNNNIEYTWSPGGTATSDQHLITRGYTGSTTEQLVASFQADSTSPGGVGNGGGISMGSNWNNTNYPRAIEMYQTWDTSRRNKFRIDSNDASGSVTFFEFDDAGEDITFGTNINLTMAAYGAAQPSNPPSSNHTLHFSQSGPIYDGTGQADLAIRNSDSTTLYIPATPDVAAAAGDQLIFDGTDEFNIENKNTFTTDVTFDNDSTITFNGSNGYSVDRVFDEELLSDLSVTANTTGLVGAAEAVGAATLGGITIRITTTVTGTGTTAIDVGDGTTANRFGQIGALTAGTTWTNTAGLPFYGPGDIYLTPDAGSFTAGAARVGAAVATTTVFTG